jgi:predicted XRE-type DNA-binding protein
MRKRFDNVWDAIEDDPAQRENMKVRSALMTVLTDFILREGLTQAQAAKKFGVTQPRISDLMRGKIDLFAIDSLVNMIGVAGLHVKVQIGKAA